MSVCMYVLQYNSILIAVGNASWLLFSLPKFVFIIPCTLSVTGHITLPCELRENADETDRVSISQVLLAYFLIFWLQF